MSRMATKIELRPEETDELNKWIKSGKSEQRKVERAKIVLRSAEGKPTHQIAKELGTRPTRVSKWRKRFAQLRVPGLDDEPRSGRRVINDESVERRILDQLAKAPPPGFARWNGRLVAESLGDVSDDAVWRVMRKHDLHLDRRQSWCVSTDPEFSRKASEIVGLYLNPPENAIVLSIDEKPSIQALERAQGCIRLPNGRAVSGFAHEYERHGTPTPFAALETATGLVKAGHYKRRRRREFLDFMNGLIDCYGSEKEIHVILDNLNTHKPKNDRWLKNHPNVHFHFTGRISDLLKFLVPKVGESFVLGHNVESQEVAQARPSPELACALETILELAALRLHCAGSDRSATLSHSLVIKMITVIEEVLDLTLELRVG